MSSISGYHAHVYFDAETLGKATRLCELAAQKFPLNLGRVHQRPIGPHPMWSCQLAFPPALFGELVPWLSLHRDGLIVFIHPKTGDELKDHTDHALWMGQVCQLDLSVLS